ncbi:MAG: hypothetical protein EPO25_02600 [Gammaproteobacteria bacterium]|nr:MAG: hypothetical protein EPO25_02600 [Gammaproteobacteria bacterium]
MAGRAQAAIVARGAATGDSATVSLPFRGLRILEFTSFWAGPLAGQFLAMLGADVIHVESTAHPDGFRSKTLRAVSDDLWWEWSPAFLGANTNTRGLTLDLQRDTGRALRSGARQLQPTRARATGPRLLGAQ